MSGWIRLNSINYYVENDIDEQDLEAFATAVRMEGIQRITGVEARNSLILPNATGGMGMPKIPAREITNPRFLRRTKVSHCDTRFIPTTPARLAADSTEPSSGSIVFKVPRTSIEFNGELVTFWEAEDANPHAEVWHADYTGSSTTWDSEIEVETRATNPATDALIPMSVVRDQDTLILFTAGAGAAAAKTQFSTDLSTWTDATTGISTAPSNAPTEGENEDWGLLVNVPGVGTFGFIWDETNSVVDVFKTTNQGVDWTSSLANAVNAPNGVHGAGLYYDLNGDVAPYFIVDDSLWAYDTSADAVHLLADFPSNANNGKANTVWHNPFTRRSSIYLSVSRGLILSYTWINTQTDPRTVFLDPDYFGALDSDMQGDFWRMAVSSQWLAFSKGGGSASETAWIGYYDGRAELFEGDEFDPSEGFHFGHQISTANRRIDFLAFSNRDDDSMRLHFSERTATTTSDTQFILEPLAPPTGPTTINYATPSAQDRPRVDMGFPHDAGALLAVALEADDLSADNTGEYINLDYGVNAATPSTDIGDILSGTRVLALASGAGVEFREVQIRENYIRDAGDTSQCAKGHDMEIIYRKKVLKVSADNDSRQTLRQLPLTINLPKSAEGQENQTAQDVLDALYTAERSSILVPLELGHLGISSDPLYVEVSVRTVNHGLETQSAEYRDQPTVLSTAHVAVRTLA